MSSNPWIRGDRCGIDNCRSRKYATDEFGITVCENGHQLLGSRGEAPDDEDSMGSMARKKTKRKKREEGKREAYLHGREALNLYLLCWQYVLRKQIWWLVGERGFPAELEPIIRALWEQYLHVLTERTSTASDSDSDTPQLFSSQASSSADTDTDMQIDTSTDDDHNTPHRHRPRPRFLHKAPATLSATPTLVHALSMCYLGAHLLRLPLFPADLLRWVNAEALPYYHAASALPHRMTARLPQHYTALLHPDGLLTPKRLFRTTAALAAAFARDAGTVLPPLNAELWVFRAVAELALPLEVGGVVGRLAGVVGWGWGYSSLSGECAVPEVRALALLIVAVKLLCPFDGRERVPETAAEVGVLGMEWERWVRARENEKEGGKNRERMTFEELMNVGEEDVLGMDEDKLDQYLDWFQRTWVHETGEDSDNGGPAQELLKFFPLEPVSAERDEERKQPQEEERLSGRVRRWIREVQSDLTFLKPISPEDEEAGDEEVQRPGSKYVRFRRVDELVGVARTFYEAVEKRSGIPISVVVKGTFEAELALEKWMSRQRKREREGEEMMEESKEEWMTDEE